MNNRLKEQSISEYLDLPQKVWFIEFESKDFRGSLATLLELPKKIYDVNSISHFWVFLSKFLEKCEIAFILRGSNTVDMALIGKWNDDLLAIPLWIMNDLLLGFEIISLRDCVILDSEPLEWTKPTIISNYDINSRKSNKDDIIVSDGVFQKQKIYLKIDSSKLSVSEYFNELEFLERISQVDIPEIDDPKDD